MFLDWIAQLDLLDHDPQTNILATLPLTTRRIILTDINKFLQASNSPNNKHGPDPSIFSSPAHVKWYMEVVAQGFALPLEDMAITNDDITIYSHWLLEPQRRPVAVAGLEQEFYQLVFQHFSLLFEPRVFHSPARDPPPQFPSQPKDRTSPTPLSPSSFKLTVLPAQAYSSGILPFNTPNHLHSSPSRSSSQLHSEPNATTAPSTTPSASTALANSNNANDLPSSYQTAVNNNPAAKDALAPLVQRHIDLCKRALAVITTAGRTLALSSETWALLLKVMLGVTDYLLKEPTGESSVNGVKNMSDELCLPLLRVLFELWLRSKISQVDMWNMLKASLTHRVMHQIYGPEEGTESVILPGEVTNVKLDLPDEVVTYVWHRILYLTPSPVTLPSLNFHLAMKGVGDIVDVLNRVGLRPSAATPLSFQDSCSALGVDAIWTKTSPPDGNTILNMFGSILFDACAVASDVGDLERQQGSAEAIGALCKIFSRPQPSRPFDRTYLERFYASLSLCLKSDMCLPTILINGMDLFAADLNGIRILAPDVVAAIKMVIPKVQLDMHAIPLPLDALRLAALKILATIMCIPNYYEFVTLKPGWEWDMQNTTAPAMGEQEEWVSKLIRTLYSSDHEDEVNRPYTNLKFYLLELLLTAFQTETSSYNMRYILHLINVYVVEDVSFCPGLVGTVIKFIQDKILTMQLPSDVSLVAFDVLMEFVDLYDYVKRESKNIARELVLALARYVDSLINARRLVHSYPLIVQAYDCMIKWVLVSQWIVDDRDCYQAVIATLSKGISVIERPMDHTPPTTEKKKRRDTGFPPPKQLFQLQPKANKTQAQLPTSTSSSSPSNQMPPADHQRPQQHQQPSAQQQPQKQHQQQQRPTYRKEELAVRMAAEYCMSQFVNHLGRPAFRSNDNPTLSDYWANMIESQLHQHRHAIKNSSTGQPQPSTPSSTSASPLSTPNSDQCGGLAAQSSGTFDYIRYFLLDNKMILAIADTANYRESQHFASLTSSEKSAQQPPHSIPALIATIRDTTGKYIWSMDARYFDPRCPQPTTPAKSPSSPISNPSLENPFATQALSPMTIASPQPLSASNSSLPLTSSSSGLAQKDVQSSAYFSSPSLPITTSSSSSAPHQQSQYQKPQYSRSKSSSTQITVTPVPVSAGHRIPQLDVLFEKNSDSWKQWRSIQQLLQLQQEAETRSLEQHADKELQAYDALIPTRHTDTDSALAFRLLLCEIGYLLPQNRYRITPLRLTDTFFNEIEALDQLNDRECISISAYFASSGDASWIDLVETPPPLAPAFLQLLNCIGWPVDLHRHNDFKGKLESSVCQTAPYFADRNVEFIVHVPYFLSLPATATSPDTATASPLSSIGSAPLCSTASHPDWTAKNTTISMIHEHVTNDDYVCVIWVENLANYANLAKRIKASSATSNLMVYLFIHPLPNTSNGLYWIRILVPPFGNTPSSIMASQRLQENALIFGPLVDGMVVGRHALGSMIRNTAISAHQACRVVTETYTRPYVIRKQYIDELAARHRIKLSLSEFYTEIFSEKEYV
ncbi:hypothetical protein DM01DRAFT_1375846 [Hesseltinella vesiculosa]|uniref:Rap-GAP domain-containing protein n=1 Tax=Hesseltinella vesiculosa TaxID=101127 RepID=A0A1X2GDF8_9FUNG|nr:hypothetical protein DM01DRAFT_1375846 [Hesseltinella vesiculosa]